MKITNNAGLPDAVVKAMEAQRHDYESDRGDGDISVTQLIAPPQIKQLMDRHSDELEEDASDRLFALMGTAMHNILEAAETEASVEERLFQEIGGWKISGKYDRLHIEKHVLQDYKFCSVYEFIFGVKEDRVAQLNVLRWLAIANGYRIDALEVVMLFRDWRPADAKRKHDYPKQQIARVVIPIWPESKVVEYILNRVELHKRAAGGERIHCTEDERWSTGHKWAVMKKGRQSALRVLDSQKDAEKYMLDNGISDMDGIHHIEYRKGEYQRCNRYCAVAPVCPQYKHDREE